MRTKTARPHHHTEGVTVNKTESQFAEARTWVQYLRDAGYEVSFQYTGEAGPFDREWQVWTTGKDAQRIATIDIDGCGASWHGTDELFKVIADRLDDGS
jgi:ribulose bisphosphate carboxylase small subunit